MRIISGKYRGKRLHPPGNFKSRPTTDFAKESLFNILMNRYDFSELEVLDLFAGTGSITFEFASRGVRSVVAVERSQAHHRFISDTCKMLDLEQVTVIRGDALRYLNNPSTSFDIIFADPPFDHPSLEELPDKVFGTQILAKEGTFILEHPRRIVFNEHPCYLEQRTYGGVCFTFFTRG